MAIKNYYEIFKLYPPLDIAQLQDAYKRLIFEFHPDRNQERQDWAIERTMEIVEAFNVLSDPIKRDLYTFQIRNDVRREPGEMFGVKKGLLSFGKTKEQVAAEEAFQRGLEHFADKDHWNQAQHEWLAAVKQVPGFANAHYNLGILCGYQGAFKDACVCFERVIKVSPMDSDAKKVLSMAMGYVYGKKA
jgi:curved DNA-binding protein CbpA